MTPRGKLRKTTNWYIEFVAGNRTMREATDFTKRLDAAEFLKKRIADTLSGEIVLSKNVTYDDLRDLIITDYTNNGRKSLGDLNTTRLPRLDAVFGGTKAIDITTTSVERYRTRRLKDGSAPATVNRERTSLKRMLRLGLRQGMVATMPYISMLAEHNVRKGFFELDQFQAILKHLPNEYHVIFELAYITGWRMKSERVLSNLTGLPRSRNSRNASGSASGSSSSGMATTYPSGCKRLSSRPQRRIRSSQSPKRWSLFGASRAASLFDG